MYLITKPNGIETIAWKIKFQNFLQIEVTSEILDFICLISTLSNNLESVLNKNKIKYINMFFFGVIFEKLNLSIQNS